jgi:hypothetical protein
LNESDVVKTKLRGEGEASTKNLAKTRAAAGLLTAMLSARLLIAALPIAVEKVNIVLFVFFFF